MVNHKVLLLDTGYSLYRLMQQNPTLREEFELLGLDFSDEVMVSDRSRLIEQISASVRSCQLVLLVDHAPQLRAREILAQGFNKPLHQNERAAADIRKYLGNQGRMPSDRLLQGAMMPQDALPLSDPGCGQAGFVLFFPNTCVALVSGSAQEVLRQVANGLFSALLRHFYPGAVTADIPIRADKREAVEDYIERTRRWQQDFLPILGGTPDHPVLRLIALREEEKLSRSCCNSFLEDLVSECGRVSNFSGVGTQGLRAVEKRQQKRYTPDSFTDGAQMNPSGKVGLDNSGMPAPQMQQLPYDEDWDDDLYEEEEEEEESWQPQPFSPEPVSRKEQKRTAKQEKVRRRQEKKTAEREEPRGRPLIVKVLLTVFVLVFAGSVSYLGYYYFKSAQNRSAYQTLRDVYDTPTLIAPAGYPSGYSKDFAALWELNPDTVGWISIDGTALDYPVVQTTDNTKYYRMNFEGEYSEHAVPFVDASDNLQKPSTNIIVYGHNIRTDGQMFNILKGYTDLSFYQEHPVIDFNSVYHDGHYKIISVFYTNTHAEHGKIFPYHEFIDAQDPQQTQDYIDSVLVRSIINTGVDVRSDDQLLTLSTCSYEFKDARFVVVARKVRKGESASVDTSAAVMNPNPLYPDVWYQLFGGTKPDETQLKAALHSAS